MQTVEDDAGKRYLLVKRSGESSLVRDPDTGAERYLPNADLDPVDDAATLVVASEGVPASVRRVLTAVRDERSLGLLLELVDRGPLPVRTLLSAYDLCESDLHGTLTEFRAAGLVEEARVAGERGYAATDLAVDAAERLRSGGADTDEELGEW
ncbi:hypothetical protein ACFO0N_12620 [Halobium salinum]|uniref:HTH domain protein n=1 Tax=Halobium salinum TaxID=1364940 RepID=A0ABD5PD14_9EURY|nr:hypothetical protein [Halobium salinum]